MLPSLQGTPVCLRLRQATGLLRTPPPGGLCKEEADLARKTGIVEGPTEDSKWKKILVTFSPAECLSRPFVTRRTKSRRVKVHSYADVEQKQQMRQQNKPTHSPRQQKVVTGGEGQEGRPGRREMHPWGPGRGSAGSTHGFTSAGSQHVHLEPT